MSNYKEPTMKYLIIAISLLPLTAFAEQLPPTMVIDTNILVMTQDYLNKSGPLGRVLSNQIEACMADNPVNGITRRSGPDNCPSVTEHEKTQEKKPVDKTAPLHVLPQNK